MSLTVKNFSLRKLIDPFFFFNSKNIAKVVNCGTSYCSCHLLSVPGTSQLTVGRGQRAAVTCSLLSVAMETQQEDAQKVPCTWLVPCEQCCCAEFDTHGSQV